MALFRPIHRRLHATPTLGSVEASLVKTNGALFSSKHVKEPNTTSNLDVTHPKKHAGDANIFPCIFVTLVFMHHIAALPTAMAYLELVSPGS